MNQNVETKPGPAAMARLVATHLRTRHTPKKHGGYDVYEDEKIRIMLDTYVPNIDVQIFPPGENPVTVFAASYTRWSNPEVFRTGEWMKYLEELLPKAIAERDRKEDERQEKERLERERRYGPVDDAIIFGARA